MKRSSHIQFFIFIVLLSTWLSGYEIITTKDGREYRGKVVKEDDKSIVLDYHDSKKGISGVIPFTKDQILKRVPLGDDVVDFERLDLTPPGTRSLSVEAYDKKIAPFENFLNQHKQSEYRARVNEVLTLWKEEKSRVVNGEIKIRNIWYSAERAEIRKFDLEAETAYAEIENLDAVKTPEKFYEKASELITIYKNSYLMPDYASKIVLKLNEIKAKEAVEKKRLSAKSKPNQSEDEYSKEYNIVANQIKQKESDILISEQRYESLNTQAKSMTKDRIETEVMIPSTSGFGAMRTNIVRNVRMERNQIETAALEECKKISVMRKELSKLKDRLSVLKGLVNSSNKFNTSQTPPAAINKNIKNSNLGEKVGRNYAEYMESLPQLSAEVSSLLEFENSYFENTNWRKHSYLTRLEQSQLVMAQKLKEMVVARKAQELLDVKTKVNNKITSLESLVKNLDLVGAQAVSQEINLLLTDNELPQDYSSSVIKQCENLMTELALKNVQLQLDQVEKDINEGRFDAAGKNLDESSRAVKTIRLGSDLLQGLLTRMQILRQRIFLKNVIEQQMEVVESMIKSRKFDEAETRIFDIFNQLKTSREEGGEPSLIASYEERANNLKSKNINATTKYYLIIISVSIGVLMVILSGAYFILRKRS